LFKLFFKASHSLLRLDQAVLVHQRFNLAEPCLGQHEVDMGFFNGVERCCQAHVL